MLLLFPVDNGFGPTYFCFSKLSLDYEKTLVDNILSNKHLIIPISEARGHFIDKYETVTTDKCGNHLTYMLAGDLVQYPTKLNKPAWAYLAALPKDTKIILYWY